MPTSLSKLNVSQWIVSLVREDDTLSNFQSIATSVSIPNITRNFDEDARAGMPGIAPVPLHYEAMEMSINFKGLVEDLYKEIAKQTSSLVKFDLSAVGCDLTDNTELQIRIVVVGYLKSSLGLELNAQESSTGEIMLSVNKLQMNIGNTEILYIPEEFIYSVDGTNILSSTASNLGITPGTTTSLII